MISTGWPLRRRGGQYWELVLKWIHSKAKQALTSTQAHSDVVQPLQLLYYGGARWCVEAEQCFTALIEVFTCDAPKSVPSSEGYLDWLLRTRDAKSLVSLHQVCIRRVRKTLGIYLPSKVSQLEGLLPEMIRRAITLSSVVGDQFEQFLERNLSEKSMLSFSKEQILLILYYLLDDPSRAFRPIRLANGETSLVELLALQMPREYVANLQRLLDLAISTHEQTAPNPAPGAAANKVAPNQANKAAPNQANKAAPNQEANKAAPNPANKAAPNQAANKAAPNPAAGAAANTAAPNPAQLGYILGAALNCAILGDCKELVLYLIHKQLPLCGTGGAWCGPGGSPGCPRLGAARSPFPIASCMDRHSCNLKALPPTLRNSLVHATATNCTCSALVVASLTDSCYSLLLLRDNHIAFDLSQVSQKFLFATIFLCKNNRFLCL